MNWTTAADISAFTFSNNITRKEKNTTMRRNWWKTKSMFLDIRMLYVACLVGQTTSTLLDSSTQLRVLFWGKKKVKKT